MDANIQTQKTIFFLNQTVYFLCKIKFGAGFLSSNVRQRSEMDANGKKPLLCARSVQ